MKRFVHWIARTTDDLGGIDDRFSSLEGRHVFDAGWVGGKVIVSAEEAAAIRNNLYMIYVLAWVPTVPIFALAAIVFLSLTMDPPAAVFSVTTVMVALGLFAAALNFAPYPYMAMAIRGKPRLEAHAGRPSEDEPTARRRRRNTTPAP